MNPEIETKPKATPRRPVVPRAARARPLVNEAEAAVGPQPAKVSKRFERGELSIFILLLLSEHGPLRRPVMTAAAFTANATKIKKQRINGAITWLLAKGYAEQSGTMRLYTYKITKEGKDYLRAEEEEAPSA